MARVERTAYESDLEVGLCGLGESERASVCEVLDRVLNKGVVVAGEITISVADVDLLYLGLQVVLTSVETARESREGGRQGFALAMSIGREHSNGSVRHDTSRV